MAKARKSKPKWHMDIRLSRIDGKPMTKADRALCDRLFTSLRSIENAVVVLGTDGEPKSPASPQETCVQSGIEQRPIRNLL